MPSTELTHKVCTGCSGKRSRTAYVPLASFADSHLRSDFFLLEGAKRLKDSARRAMLKDASPRASHCNPHDLVREVCLASSRRVQASHAGYLCKRCYDQASAMPAPHQALARCQGYWPHSSHVAGNAGSLTAAKACSIPERR